jgi:hypothetical protein
MRNSAQCSKPFLEIKAGKWKQWNTVEIKFTGFESPGKDQDHPTRFARFVVPAHFFRHAKVRGTGNITCIDQPISDQNWYN